MKRQIQLESTIANARKMDSDIAWQTIYNWVMTYQPKHEESQNDNPHWIKRLLTTASSN